MDKKAAAGFESMKISSGYEHADKSSKKSRWGAMSLEADVTAVERSKNHYQRKPGRFEQYTSWDSRSSPWSGPAV